MAENPPVDGEAKGEPKVSKRAAEKAAKKAHKATFKANAPTKPAKQLPERSAKQAAQAPDVLDTDPMDACFKVGWLKDVYTINDAQTNVTTRFPPEPNGFLHIGHAKAIAVNFGFAKFYNGKCYLRYDDTNPEKEEGEYFESIKEMVEWLGYKPYNVTYSSDHFGKLYELAEDLIQKDKAYVCACSQDEIVLQKGGKDNRGPRHECVHRNRPVSESLSEFRAMRDGKYKPKEVFLRMKMDILNSGNPYMWDMAAYRITERTYHHRTKDQWRIYPTYDFTHCLCDAFESITHSLCTVEFRTARESYDWLLHELKDEKYLPQTLPQQREYGRLNVEGTLLSKRKIQKLVEQKIVRGWDDPRLYTLIGLRRRGVPPGAIRAFVADLGVSDSVTTIQLVRLETVVRRYLERTVPRLMLVLDPIKVIIDDLPEDHNEDISLEFMRGDPTMGAHVVPFTRNVYIDRSDFHESDNSDFFRLSPSQPVGLLNVPYPIRATSFSTDPVTGLVNEIRAAYCRPAPGTAPVKPKAFIQWVAESPKHRSPVKAEVRIFKSLFKSLHPEDVEGGFLNDVAPDSEEVYPNAVLEVGFQEVRKNAPWPKDEHIVPRLHPGSWDVRFQGLRVAYFALDTESTEDKIILNKIVSLKEDAGKASQTLRE